MSQAKLEEILFHRLISFIDLQRAYNEIIKILIRKVGCIMIYKANGSKQKAF